MISREKRVIKMKCDKCGEKPNQVWETEELKMFKNSSGNFIERNVVLCEQCLTMKHLEENWNAVKEFMFKNIVEKQKCCVTRHMDYIHEQYFSMFNNGGIRFMQIVESEGIDDSFFICKQCGEEMRDNNEIMKHALKHVNVVKKR